MNASSSENVAHALIVDNDRETRDLLVRFLTKHAYRVTAVQDGKETPKTFSQQDIF